VAVAARDLSCVRYAERIGVSGEEMREKFDGSNFIYIALHKNSYIYNKIIIFFN
jgi:hypothetical protein